MCENLLNIMCLDLIFISDYLPIQNQFQMFRQHVFANNYVFIVCKVIFSCVWYIELVSIVI